jgi:hypothetical protein
MGGWDEVGGSHSLSGQGEKLVKMGEYIACVLLLLLT